MPRILRSDCRPPGSASACSAAGLGLATRRTLERRLSILQELENTVPATLRNDCAFQSSTGMVVLALTSMDSPMGSLACRRAIPGPAATGTIGGTPTLVLAQTYYAEVPTIWHLSKCLQDGEQGLTTRVTGLEPTGYGVHRNHLSALLSVRLLVSNWTGQFPRTP